MPDISSDKSYLGDGAFVQIGSFQGEVVLTTEDGVAVQNRVVLDEQGVLNLFRWLIVHEWKITIGGDSPGVPTPLDPKKSSTEQSDPANLAKGDS